MATPTVRISAPLDLANVRGSAHGETVRRFAARVASDDRSANPPDPDSSDPGDADATGGFDFDQPRRTQRAK